MSNDNERQWLKASTTHLVGYWYVPGGYDYSNAQALIIECDSEEEAESVACDKGKDFPAMASVMSRQQYEIIQESIANRQRSID
jgi:hypothetical protein